MEWRWLSLQAPPPTHPLIRSLCVKRGANNGRRIKGSFIRGPYKQLSLWILRKWTAGQMNLSKTVWCLRRDTYEGLHQIDGNSHRAATQYNTDTEWFEMGGGGECWLMPEAEVASDAAVVSCLLLHVWALTRRHIKYCRQTMIYRLLRQELFRICCANSASFNFFIQPIATIVVPLTTSTVPMPEWKPSVQFYTTSHNFLCKAIQLTQPNCIFNTSFINTILF